MAKASCSCSSSSPAEDGRADSISDGVLALQLPGDAKEKDVSNAMN